MGEFIQKNQTTRDTVRFYIERGLLLPQKKGRNYWFTEQETANFSEIRALRALGFSIAMIEQFNENRKYCGTITQWEKNQNIVQTELSAIRAEIQSLEARYVSLNKVVNELSKRLTEKQQTGEG